MARMGRPRAWVRVPSEYPSSLLGADWASRGAWLLLCMEADNYGKVTPEGVSKAFHSESFEGKSDLLKKLTLTNTIRAVPGGWVLDGFPRRRRHKAQPDDSLDFPSKVISTNCDPSLLDLETTSREEEETKETGRNSLSSETPTIGKLARGRPPADNRHRPVIDLWCRLWVECRGGGSYLVNGGTDGRNLRRLLHAVPTATMDEIETRMRRFFADPWLRANGSLSLFCSRWSSLDGAGLASTTKKPTVVDFDPYTNTLTYSDGTTAKA